MVNRQRLGCAAVFSSIYLLRCHRLEPLHEPDCKSDLISPGSRALPATPVMVPQSDTVAGGRYKTVASEERFRKCLRAAKSENWRDEVRNQHRVLTLNPFC